MNIVIKISLRNLIRQKRRNLLLGIAMTFGVMILVIANSFTNGLSDILFNKIAKWAAGHVSINFLERGNARKMIFRDGQYINDILNKHKDVILDYDDGASGFGRVVGNKKADTVILIPIDTTKAISKDAMKEVEEQFKMLEGSWLDLGNDKIEYPVVLSKEKADYLQVKTGDAMKLRIRNIYGQDQAAKLTVVGVFKNANVFMNVVIFMELRNLKQLIAYKSYETGDLVITVKDPKHNAIPLAEKLHSELKPRLAAVPAKLAGRDVVVCGFKTDDGSIKTMRNLVKLSRGNPDKVFVKNGVIIPTALAAKTGSGVGSKIELKYKTKFDNGFVTLKYKVTGVYTNAGLPADNVILVDEEKYYDTYYANLPEDYAKLGWVILPKETDPMYAVISPEWFLLERSKTTDQLQRTLQLVTKKKWKGTVVDVRTMYESGSDIIKLEAVLNVITFAAVLVLFFIILIGVINTLRMSIRERTREIGTIRSIGMQKKDVRNTFILETVFLSLFSAVAGTILALIVMFIISLIPINMGDNAFFDMLLVNNRFHFIPTITSILFNIVFMVVIAVITSYFPAKRAANMLPSTALRHYE
jgi:ABC-type lipoprotein release transport system permease subunit